MRRVYSLSLPVIGELSLQHGLAAVDALFVAKLGLLSLNAVGVTSMFSVILLSILNALGVTVTVFLSRATTDSTAKATSEKNPSHARSLVWHGLVMGGSVGLTVAIFCLLFATPLLHLAGAQGELQRTAMPYFFLVLSSTPVLALQTMLAACLRASGDTQTPLKVGLQMNLVHVALDALFIFGFDMGVAGAGVAYLLVQFFTFGLYLRRAAQLLPTRRDLKLSRPILARMLRFAVPAVIERLFKRGGQAVYLSFVVRMGTEPYAANNIANTLALFTSLLGDGLATGVSIAMGQEIGDETSDRQTLQARLTDIRRWGFLGAAVSMTLTTLLLWCLSPWISLWFTDEPHVIQLISLVLGIYIFCQPFFAANLIDCAAIQAGGNSTYTMWVTILGVWGVRLVFIPILIYGFHLGLSGVWMCIGLDHMTRAYLYRRYRLKRDILYVP